MCVYKGGGGGGLAKETGKRGGSWKREREPQTATPCPLFSPLPPPPPAAERERIIKDAERERKTTTHGSWKKKMTCVDRLFFFLLLFHPKWVGEESNANSSLHKLTPPSTPLRRRRHTVRTWHTPSTGRVRRWTGRRGLWPVSLLFPQTHPLCRRPEKKFFYLFVVQLLCICIRGKEKRTSSFRRKNPSFFFSHLPASLFLSLVFL